MKEYIFSRPDEADDTVKRDAYYRGELIRCKDCKHHGEQYGNGYCMKDGCYGWCDEDYCSRAERKPPQVNPEMVKALKDRIEKQRGEE